MRKRQRPKKSKDILMQAKEKIRSAFFVTFNGNCKKALVLYQSCFGGKLYFDSLSPSVGRTKEPIVSGCLMAYGITIYGSDLVQDEGRHTGNHIALFIQCRNTTERWDYLQKLLPAASLCGLKKSKGQILIEAKDSFDVVWVFGI